MPCGKKRARKLWDRHRDMEIVTPSRYEQNEASVKKHWLSVLNDLELSCKDEKFWETTGDQVHDLVGDVIFERLRKIFGLPQKPPDYQMKDDTSTIVSSAGYYDSNRRATLGEDVLRSTFSISDFSMAEEEDEQVEEEEMWSVSSEIDHMSEQRMMSRTKSLTKSAKSLTRSSKLYAKSKSANKIPSKFSSKSFSSAKSKSDKSSIGNSSLSESATAFDDMEVQIGDHKDQRSRHHVRNPYYQMLYCAESETDMIKWKSKYKQKKYEISASDEFSKRAEIKTKMIATEFFEWWANLGSEDFKSEIRKPEDIEALFQVWFDEHASRGLVLDPRILPCVLRSIAEFVGVPENSCAKVLEKQIQWDIVAETSPAHTVAFGKALPAKMKHIPPKNNTKEIWQCLKIPEDLASMACVWGDIQHLTSTKSFEAWLRRRPHLPTPVIFQSEQTLEHGSRKQLLVVPSDFMVRDASTSEVDLAIPFSQVNVQLKDVLSKLMNQN